ncbi:MAG: hypothetical protein J7J09_08570 [Kosmotoga sp.]|uniref:hypothetical protein n=1 Tax=Kosmotoga sp. TaxID=1955248 RepID=UPI0025BC91E2|nr:hypothetical protein [Kosmotoga sp.]MCD6160666.1 hypothetical protein [Kosmotoga sp.]
MIAIGLFMLICGLIKSDFIVYRLMAARSKLLWGKNVHRFYQIVGAIVIVIGILVVFGVIWQ